MVASEALRRQETEGVIMSLIDVLPAGWPLVHCPTHQHTFSVAPNGTKIASALPMVHLHKCRRAEGARW